VTWFTPPELIGSTERETSRDGFYNLGLAHGTPGVIGVLGPMRRAGIRPDLTDPMLHGAVSWLLRQQIESPVRSFGYEAGGERGARLAWCYGDPGVASGLFVAANAVGNEAWQETALDIARRSAPRMEGSGVVDASLCHGSAGLSLIHHRFHHRTNDPAFAAASRAWIEHTLQNRREEGLAGYPSRLSDKDGRPRWDADPGLLVGASGVGLSLLAAISDVEPHWDRCLLLSVRDQGEAEESGKP
jgi:hypothetical protein